MKPSIEEMRLGFIVMLRLVADGAVPPRVVDATAARDLLTVLQAPQ